VDDHSSGKRVFFIVTGRQAARVHRRKEWAAPTLGAPAGQPCGPAAFRDQRASSLRHGRTTVAFSPSARTGS
jgi:hypothetical protein